MSEALIMSEECYCGAVSLAGEHELKIDRNIYHRYFYCTRGSNDADLMDVIAETL